MGIFSGLDKLGLGDLSDTKVLEEKKISEKEEAAPVEKKEEDYLYDKKYKCPVCDANFVTRFYRTGKLKLEKKDTDLRPIYEFMDLTKYDAVCCEICGYAAMNRYFPQITMRQLKLIKEKITPGFKGIDNRLVVYSYDDAIMRHKLALLCSVVKGAKNSERAYTSLKLAWMLRAKRESIGNKNMEVVKALYNDELECLGNAYNGFEAAISNESFPIAGMDEITLKYMMADIARRLKNYQAAAKLVSEILVSKAAPQRIKDQAYAEKELIKRDMKIAAASSATMAAKHNIEN